MSGQLKFWVGLCVCSCAVWSVSAVHDSIPQAITVYRNPEFFRHVHYESDGNIYEFSNEPGHFEESNEDNEDNDGYRYPGETKKTNKPSRPTNGFDVNYDTSPEFNHEPRDIFRDYTPKKGRGPYGHPQYEEDDASYEEENPSEQLDEDPEQHNELVHEIEEVVEDPDTYEESRPGPSSYEDPRPGPNTYEESYDEPPSNSYDGPKTISYEGPKTNSHEESTSYSRPTSYEESTSYSQPEETDTYRNGYNQRDTYSHPIGKPKGEPELIIDKKRGTREYYKYHPRPGEDGRESEEYRGHKKAGSKLVYKKLYVPRKIKPVLLLNYYKKPKKSKFKIKFRPRLFKLVKRSAREVLDDSAYQLNSELDSEYESFTPQRH